ncbi:MAG TPA: carboxypeptidase-like regulatory domain-containing protein [Chthoniobacterales bacterium]|nr:carboxypeptidase-like regulatory domain-containing protein [Chthoniobacterales bacterium]
MKRIAVSLLTRLLTLGAFIWAGNSLAASSALEGMVKDGNGRPIAGADVRIEARNGHGSSGFVKSDARGHYTYDGLAPGVTYRVTLLINGAVKASINNVLAKSGSTELNFALKTTSASGDRMVTKNGKHYVYIPAETGSHLGGRWVEVDENGQADSANVNNVERAGSEALRRMQSNSGAMGNMTGGGH